MSFLMSLPENQKIVAFENGRGENILGSVRLCWHMLTVNSVCLCAAGTATDTTQPVPPPPEAPPTEPKVPEEEMDVTDDDITAGEDTPTLT